MVLLLGFMNLASCNSSVSSKGPPAADAYRAALYQKSHLVIDPTGKNAPRTRYQIAAGDGIVLLFDQKHSGRPLTYDTAKEWVIAVEFAARDLDQAMAAGPVDIEKSGLRVFARAATGEVMYLSFAASGTVALNKTGDSMFASVDLQFRDPAIALTSEKTLPLKGRFQLRQKTP